MINPLQSVLISPLFSWSLVPVQQIYELAAGSEIDGIHLLFHLHRQPSSLFQFSDPICFSYSKSGSGNYPGCPRRIQKGQRALPLQGLSCPCSRGEQIR